MSRELISLPFNQLVIAMSTQFDLAVLDGPKQINFRHRVILLNILIITGTQQSNLRLHRTQLLVSNQRTLLRESTPAVE
jgi:hypothetical protein